MAGGKRNQQKKARSSPPPVYTDDGDVLVDDLLAHLDARDSHVQYKVAELSNKVEIPTDNATKKNSRSRFKAREMRKEAARAAQQTQVDVEASERITKEIEDEERTIRGICEAKGLEMYEINPDGHCLFAAVADQLALLSIIPADRANYRTTRHAAAGYMASHPDDFLPFLPSIDGEDGTGRTDTGFMSSQEFQKYCASIRDTATWGGEPEVLAMARAFDIPIHVVQWGTPPVVIHSPHTGVGEVTTDRVVQISYHRRMYGLGEHYNSLRPKRKQDRRNSIRNMDS